MKPVIEINSAPFVLPNDPLAALEEIASYLSAINYQKSHAVIANEDGEEPYLKGYWQTPEYLQGCQDIVSECRRIVEMAKPIEEKANKRLQALESLNAEFAAFARRQGWKHTLVDEHYALNEAIPTLTIGIDDFIEIDSYEDCPCDQEIVVFTGDSFEIEHVTSDGDTGHYYPANGIEFVAYLMLPDRDQLTEKFAHKF
ncbi:TPA: hypothetical protein L3302_003435 [Vibrio cholerae]|nr:hypothetical protein [Vibrio cholerae]HBN6897525.1 hypothetical protein [Vibrio cholerae]HDI3136510.1 hypothetical protein [Vibrio cholerae]